MTYQDTLDYLFSQLPVYQKVGKTAFKKDLTNITEICQRLNHPQKKLKCIHIAGTNGKGSTSHMIASVLQEANYKVGLYTSPHLKDFRERIRINGEMISEKEVIQFVEKNKNLFDDISPSFFEWTVGLAFYHFSQEKVDFAVIETGLGGRLDSTNIIDPILSVITNIGFDHMDMLGDTLDKIAFEKAGIIKENTPVVIGNASGQESVFLKKAKSVNAPIIFAQNTITKAYTTDLKGDYQRENLQTTIVALDVLRKSIPIQNAVVKNGLNAVVANTKLRGRWEVIREAPKIILETAHNLEGFQMVTKQLQSTSFDRLIMILGFVKQKPVEKIIDVLPPSAEYIICKAKINRSEEAETIVSIFHKKGIKAIAIENLSEAITTAIQQTEENDCIYIGGSNFVVAEALDFFDKEFDF